MHNMLADKLVAANDGPQAGVALIVLGAVRRIQAAASALMCGYQWTAACPIHGARRNRHPTKPRRTPLSTTAITTRGTSQWF